MGYYTSFDLRVEGDTEKVSKFERDLYDVATVYQKEDIKTLIEEGSVYAKLYELDNAISKAAEMNPDVLVILDGDGEDSGDLWEQRWKGTDTEFKEADIPPFENPVLLTEKEKEKQTKK